MLRSRGLHVLLWFIVVGPLVTAMLYLPEKALLNGHFTPGMLMAGLPVFFSPIVFIGAYALFIVPSALTGLLATTVAARLRAAIFIAVTTLAGGLVYAVYIQLAGRAPALSIITFSILGASVAVCCASLAVWSAGRR